MKNIHLIPTDKPTRLYYNGTSYKDANSTMAMDWYISSGYKPHNICITSNEEIKEGDIFIHPDGTIERASSNLDGRGISKIILTDNKDLIKDGVEPIDDEFLEWFVKNPSCEEVEVKIEIKQLVKPYDVYNEIVSFYKTIIPKEEYIKCGDCNKHYLCTTCGVQCGSEGHFIESTKQETTLDEAAEKYAESKSSSFSFRTTHIRDFTAGAKWQAERSYSEKEVLAMLIIKHDALTAEYVLEQFKKK